MNSSASAVHAVACGVVLCLAACQNEFPASRVTPVALPEGGALVAGTILPGPGALQPIVLTERSLYTRSQDLWRPLNLARTTAASSTRAFPGSGDEQLLWMPCPGQRQGNFFGDQERLWMVTRGVVNPTPRLWSVSPGSSTWQEEVLPLPFQRSTRASRARNLASRSEEDGGEGVCVFSYESRLHVMAMNRLWVLDAQRSEDEPLQWQEIALQGITDRAAISARPGLVPLMLRHYFPATERYPFDVLTVLGEQLQIYRRDVRHARWVLVSVLPVIDLDMWRDADTGAVMIMTAHTLYQSLDLESWERYPVLGREEADEDCTAFQVLSGEYGGHGNVVLVGTNNGRILRSSDGGRSFTQVRERDRDRRAITQIMSVQSEDASELWALTAGEGALLGEEQGKQWREQNAGLTATMPTAIDRAQDDLILGTDAGLYLAKDRMGAAFEWSRVLERSVTAVLVTLRHVLVGTHGGALLATSLERSEQSFQELADDAATGVYPMMLPEELRGVELAPESIVALVSRGDGVEVQAKTLGRGSWESDDGGATWGRGAEQPGLVQALQGHRMVQWIIPPGSEVSYVVSRGLGGVGRAMLWRKDSLDGVWRNVTTFTQDESDSALLYLVALGPQRLLKVQPRGIEISEDGGYSWRASGVETGDGVLAASATSQGVMVLGMSAERAQVMRVEATPAGSPTPFTVERHRLDVTLSRFEPEDVQEMLWMESRMVFRTTMGVWEAPLFQKPPRQSRGIVLLMTMLGSMVMVTIAFALVHGYRRPRR